MPNEIDLWRFVQKRLRACESVMLLVVAESQGSSPGRAGYKMAVAADGEMIGSIGGGVMEVRLVERAKSKIRNFKSEIGAKVIDQVHRKDSADSSGMICSGRQTVIIARLGKNDLDAVQKIIDAVDQRTDLHLTITPDGFDAGPPEGGTQNAVLSPGFSRPSATARNDYISFERRGSDDFIYRECLNRTNHLYIVGGGHCSLALSEMMSRLDFRVSVFDDRPQINTIEANAFADEITIIDTYSNIASAIPNGDNIYVAVMTIGYEFDAVVIRQLLDHDLKYFGVLGSRSKMATLMKELKNESHPGDRLARIRTPIGLDINSHTPEEIAVSIAAEIVSVKNSAL